MVVLSVIWMAKPGQEAQVAELFSKLQEQSRKEPGCQMYQVHPPHRTTSHLPVRATQGRCGVGSPQERLAFSGIRQEEFA